MEIEGKGEVKMENSDKTDVTFSETEQIKSESVDYEYVVNRGFVHKDDLILVSDIPADSFIELGQKRAKMLNVNIGIVDKSHWYVNIDRIILLLNREALQVLKSKQVIYIYFFNSENPVEYISLTYQFDLETLLKIEGIMDFLEKSGASLAQK